MAFAVGNAQPAVWVPDTASESCSACSLSFSITRRRHHCRVCGGLFCNTCSQQRVTGTGSSGALRVCDAWVREADGSADHARDKMMWDQERGQLQGGITKLQDECCELQKKVEADQAELEGSVERANQLSQDNAKLTDTVKRLEEQAAAAMQGQESEAEKIARECEAQVAEMRLEARNAERAQAAEQAAAREREFMAEMERMKSKFESMLADKQREIEELKTTVKSQSMVPSPPITPPLQPRDPSPPIRERSESMPVRPKPATPSKIPYANMSTKERVLQAKRDRLEREQRERFAALERARQEHEGRKHEASIKTKSEFLGPLSEDAENFKDSAPNVDKSTPGNITF